MWPQQSGRDVQLEELGESFEVELRTFGSQDPATVSASMRTNLFVNIHDSATLPDI